MASGPSTYLGSYKNSSQKSLLFQAQLAMKPEGYWFAWIAALPGCAAWGASKDEALAMLTQTGFPGASEKFCTLALPSW
jgi:hypothetical protein